MPLDKEKKPLKKNTLETAPKADHKPIAKRKLKSTRNVESVIKPKKQILTKNVAIAPSATKNEIQAADAEIEELFKNKKTTIIMKQLAVGKQQWRGCGFLQKETTALPLTINHWKNILVQMNLPKLSMRHCKMNCAERFTVTANVNGGGINAQAAAMRHGIARALVLFNPDFKKRLKKQVI